MAAMRGDEAILDLLLSYKAGPNKTYSSYGGALLTLAEYGGAHQPSLAILGKLFEAGVAVPPDIIRRLPRLNDNVVSFIITHILLSQHAEFFL